MWSISSGSMSGTDFHSLQKRKCYCFVPEDTEHKQEQNEHSHKHIRSHYKWGKACVGSWERVSDTGHWVSKPWERKTKQTHKHETYKEHGQKVLVQVKRWDCDCQPRADLMEALQANTDARSGVIGRVSDPVLTCRGGWHGGLRWGYIARTRRGHRGHLTESWNNMSCLGRGFCNNIKTHMRNTEHTDFYCEDQNQTHVWPFMFPIFRFGVRLDIQLVCVFMWSETSGSSLKWPVYVNIFLLNTFPLFSFATCI